MCNLELDKANKLNCCSTLEKTLKQQCNYKAKNVYSQRVNIIFIKYNDTMLGEVEGFTCRPNEQ